jgi:uncharacterized protein YwqG
VAEETLESFCKTLPGVYERDSGNYTEYVVLNGSLSILARLHKIESDRKVVFRCRDNHLSKMQEKGLPISVSPDFKWEKKDGWIWAEMPLEKIRNNQWQILLNESYIITLAGESKDNRVIIELLKRGYSVEQGFDKLLGFYDLTHFKTQILKVARPSLLIKSTTASSEPRLGQSKLGGTPDLPPSLDWPKSRDGKSFAFIAQINLAELPKATLPDFPSQGILYFFSLYGRCVEGEEPYYWTTPQPKEPPRSVVLYAASADKLNRSSPEPDVNQYPSSTVEFIPSRSLPSNNGELNWSKLGFDQESCDNFDRFYTRMLMFERERHAMKAVNRLGGYANFSVDFNPIIAKNDMQLLLEVDSDDNSNLNWGDAGKMYFWITPNGLQRKNFNEIFAEMHAM